MHSIVAPFTDTLYDAGRHYENISGESVYYSVWFAQVSVTGAVYTRHRCAHLGTGGECHSDGFSKRYHTAKVFESAHGRARYPTGITHIRGVRREGGGAHF